MNPSGGLGLAVVEASTGFTGPAGLGGLIAGFAFTIRQLSINRFNSHIIAAIHRYKHHRITIAAHVTINISS